MTHIIQNTKHSNYWAEKTAFRDQPWGYYIVYLYSFILVPFHSKYTIKLIITRSDIEIHKTYWEMYPTIPKLTILPLEDPQSIEKAIDIIKSIQEDCKRELCKKL